MSKDKPQNDSTDRSEAFVRLLKKHERRLNAYVFSLVHNWNDAEDILQEVAVDLWRRFDAYDPAGDFGAWACTVAYYQVLSYRKRKGRQRVRFSEESARLLSEEIAVVSEETTGHQDILGKCLEKLNETQRKLLRAYYSGTPIAELAERFARKIASLYKDLANLRRGLRACVERSAREEERS
jgi:RNA polymerase sigma-70 factor, ECF subfamily